MGKKFLEKNSYEKGHQAEFYAMMLLRLKGFRILEQRYKTPWGEVDIIARRGKLLIFVEVKYRATFRDGLEAIQKNQRRRIENASQCYLQSCKVKTEDCRFDAIIISHGSRWPIHCSDVWRVGE